MKGREGGREENEEKEEEDKNCQMNERLFNLNHRHMTKAHQEREIVQAQSQADLYFNSVLCPTHYTRLEDIALRCNGEFYAS